MLKAILIDLVPLGTTTDEQNFRIQEAESLIKTYGGIVVVKSYQKKINPNYKTYIGTGKLEEIREMGKTMGANILIVNNELKPQQVYNLSEHLRKDNIEVWDRIDLILKIFQKHAQTKEAQLEIELASVKHMGPRIYGMGMVLSRQMGGIGGRGIGETNTEIMKRHLAAHTRKLQKQLESTRRSRDLHRLSRKRKNFLSVGIIGYTNAGKSTLLNSLSSKQAYVANELFATLDTRVGELKTGNHNRKILITDTIGFIQDLPPELIKSFQSTLDETIEADLLLHTIDLSDSRWEFKIAVVNEVLANLGINGKTIFYVFNKIDLLDNKFNLQPVKKKYKKFDPTFVSALNSEGITALKDKIIKYFNGSQT